MQRLVIYLGKSVASMPQGGKAKEELHATVKGTVRQVRTFTCMYIYALVN